MMFILGFHKCALNPGNVHDVHGFGEPQLNSGSHVSTWTSPKLMNIMNITLERSTFLRRHP
eukprot:3025136-Amphidinium_carterae.1